MDSMHIKMQANSLISSCDSGRKGKILAKTVGGCSFVSGWLVKCCGIKPNLNSKLVMCVLSMWTV